METTGKALAEHWNWAAQKGLLNKNTARSFGNACSQVLSAQEDPDNVNVSALDVELALTKFQNLKKKNFKPKVLEVYKSRFRRALALYLSYIEDPAGWRPTSPRASRPTEEPNKKSGAPKKEEVMVGVGEHPGMGLVEYPFPLRDGQNARLILPRDLKAAEVKRLTAFMASLAVDSSS